LPGVLESVDLGVLEWWSIEKKYYTFSHYSNTPTLHYSNAPE
jgi:hypothetical protein